MMVLRPEFTSELARQLLEGASLNLISQHGQGRRRTIQDLCHILPHDVKVFYCDMKRHRGKVYDWLAQIRDVCHETNQNIMIIHNMQPELYEAPLLNILQQIEDQHHTVLLTVSEEKKCKSLLGYKNVILPLISKEQVMNELQCRDFSITKTSHSKIADWVLTQPSPYTLLDRLNSLETNVIFD